MRRMYSFECSKCFSGCERLVDYEERDAQLCSLCGGQLVSIIDGSLGIIIEGGRDGGHSPPYSHGGE